MSWHGFTSWMSDQLSIAWENAEKIGNLAQVFIVLAAVFALLFARQQIYAARRVRRETTAKEIYRGYLENAFEHPELAIPSPEMNIAADKYRWFVAILLNASDEILYDTTAYVWRKVIMAELRYHIRYLQSREFHDEDRGWNLYSTELKSLADEVVNDARRQERQTG
jgi:hypothetical protein